MSTSLALLPTPAAPVEAIGLSAAGLIRQFAPILGAITNPLPRRVGPGPRGLQAIGTLGATLVGALPFATGPLALALPLAGHFAALANAQRTERRLSRAARTQARALRRFGLPGPILGALVRNRVARDNAASPVRDRIVARRSLREIPLTINRPGVGRQRIDEREALLIFGTGPEADALRLRRALNLEASTRRPSLFAGVPFPRLRRN